MRISAISGQRVGLLGLGREGSATLAALQRAGHARDVTVFLDQPAEMPAGARLADAASLEAELANLDVLVRSPGFSPRHRLRQAADQCAVVQTTATNLFLAELREHGVPVIGITGSKGKSTTSTLVHLTLRAAGVPAVLVGNIGVAALDQLDGILRERSPVVMELSSYQCADLPDGHGPAIAAILDLFPEHIDWHGSVAEYYAAKARIASSQRDEDRLFCNPGAMELLAETSAGRRAEAINVPGGWHFRDGWFWRGEARLFDDHAMLLRGVHNRRNAVAALAMASELGAEPQHLERVLGEFGGLPFRLEEEGVWVGIRWINDSLSTAPEAAAAAVRSVDGGVHTLIAGGHDRGYDASAIIDAVGDVGVRLLLVLPDTGRKIAGLARERCVTATVRECETLDEAVRVAASETPRGAVCVFSPGAPSYNRYSSFEERGRHFRALVRAA